MKKIKEILGYALIAVELIIVLFVCVSRFMGEQTTIFGYQLNIISSPSMTPELKVGDVIISEEYDNQLLEEGHIITYISTSNDTYGKRITHRIVDIYEKNGQTYVITKGDASLSEDTPITLDQVQSVYVSTSIVISFIYKILINPFGFVFLIVIPIVSIIVSETISIFKSTKGKEEAKNEKE